MRRRTGRLPPQDRAAPNAVLQAAPNPALQTGPHGEPRLPVVLTLLVAMAIPLLMPDELIPGSRWLVPSIIFVLLVAMLVLDPGRIDRRSLQLHWLRLGTLLVLAVGTGYGTVELTRALVAGSAAITNSPEELLRAGGLVWLGLLITFGFLYWELDMGGPGERAHIERDFPDSGLSPGPKPVDRASWLVPDLHRLPLPGVDKQPCLQPHRRHAVKTLGKTGHGPPVRGVLAGPGPGHRSRRQHLQVNGYGRHR